MWFLCVPGVYRPQADTSLLIEALGEAAVPAGARVLDVGTGSGALAVAAARAGARSVLAVDVSRRAVASAWLNARVRSLPVTVRHGDAFTSGLAGRFDVILANPPYVPSALARSVRWDAGADGRSVLGPLCARSPHLLTSRGFLLLVQSALSGVPETLSALREHGLKASVVARRTQPFGPVLRERAGFLEERGLIEWGQREEELVVIRADRTRKPG